MKPVEIEFLMRDKLSDGMDKIGQGATSLGDKTEQASKRITDKIAEQRTVIQQVENDLKNLEKQYAHMAPGSSGKLEMIAEIRACKNVLDEEKAALAGVEQQMESSNGKQTTLRTQIRNLKDEMARMTEGTAEYADAMRRLGELQDQFGDISQQGRVMADDEKNIRATTDALTGLTGIMTAGVGAASLFGAQEEKLAQIQTKLQSVMAISMGIQQAANALNKDSYFRIVLLGQAKTMLTSANTRLAVSLGISNASAKALMATLTVGLTVAIGAAIYLWDKFSTAQAKAREENKKFGEAVSVSAKEVIVTFNKLKQQWDSLADNLKAKEEFILKNKDAFKSLGVEINNVYEAENLLVNNADAFVQSTMQKARAAAAMELASEKYQEAIKKQQEADAMPKGGGSQNKKWYGKLQEVTQLNAEGDAMIKNSIAHAEQGDKLLKDAGINSAKVLVEGSVAAIEALISQKRESLKKITDPKEYQKIQQEINAEEKKLRRITGAKNGDSSSKPTNNLAELEVKARQKIEDQNLVLMKEGYEKERQQAALNFAREKERITKEESDRMELYEKLRKTGVKVDPEQKVAIKVQAETQKIQAAQLYDADLFSIGDKEAKEMDAAFKQLLEPYRTFAQQRIDLELKYNSEIAQLRKAGASPESIQLAETAKSDALDELDASFAQKEVTFQAFLSQITNMSLEKLSEALDQAQRLLRESDDTSGQDSEKSATLRAKIKVLSDEIKFLRAENGLKTPDDSAKWKRNSSAIKSCKAEIDGMLSSMDGLDESTRSALQAASNIADGAINMIDGIKALGIGAAQSLSAVEKASVILAIVGAAVQIMTAIFSMASAAEERHQEALRQIASSKLAMQREYNLLLLQQNLLLKEASNVFGEEQIRKATNAIEQYRKALQLYDETIKGVDPSKLFAGKNQRVLKFIGIDLDKEKAEYEKGLKGLSDIQVKTGHKKTGFMGWGKGKDTYTGVLELYDDLIDGENRLNVERAKAILSTQQMSNENKALLQDLIVLQNQADEALESLRQYLQDTFGELGNGIMDSIVDAIQNDGVDAWKAFGDKGAEVLENLGKQLTYTLFFHKKFDALQKQLEDIYGSGKSEEEIARDSMDLLGNFYKNIGTDMQNAQAFMEGWQAEAKKQGFDLWKKNDSESQSAKSGGFQTLTQDQGTKLEGLFTSLQMHGASVDDKMDDLGDSLHEALEVLGAIAEHTAYCLFLKQIAEDIGAMKRDGIKAN